ncbi:hypothetical protein PYW08_008131 [Mythimna loreyi]|uniref:Uncharacterized protein n=1 Tax=Mythimna loreyi TaxID=667449 RepID=A0ACC2QBN6_9NEOP|nr:hypothetical protein PYW08_008131 [Mythimna loreyi]
MDTFNWNNKSIFELIRLVETKPELWDTSSKYFKNKEKKQEAWLEIANAMNTQVSTVEKKMRVLVSQYRRELFTKRNSKWFAFQRLSFLGTRPKAESRKYQQRPYFDSVEQDREKQISRPNVQSTGLETRLEKPTAKDRTNITRQREHKTEERDEYTTYGELVAMKLKKIENSYARSTAQYHINNILYKAEIGEYDKPKKGNRSNSKEHFTAENSSIYVDLNDDVQSSRSSSPTKSMDYDLKLEESDENSS